MLLICKCVLRGTRHTAQLSVNELRPRTRRINEQNLLSKEYAL